LGSTEARAGDREVFAEREGFSLAIRTFIQLDLGFKNLVLRSFAQLCKNPFSPSKTGEFMQRPFRSFSLFCALFTVNRRTQP
jgi:hypothetical protein